MAGVARLWKVHRYVIRVGGLFEFREMARRAIGQHTILPPDHRLVASLAFHCGMRANQWKKILVIAHLLARREPALHHVALRAVRAEFAQVDIGVAIGTVFADIGENGFGMALRAGHALVHAPQCVTRVVVIEIRSGSDRAPARGGVAILAGQFQRAVRIGRHVPLRKG